MNLDKWDAAARTIEDDEFTSAGKVFFGIDYAARDVKFALMESSEGRIGAVTEKLLLYCYHYDPASGRYGVIVMNFIRAGGVLTMALIVGVMLFTRRRQPQAPVEGRA